MESIFYFFKKISRDSESFISFGKMSHIFGANKELRMRNEKQEKNSGQLHLKVFFEWAVIIVITRPNRECRTQVL